MSMQVSSTADTSSIPLGDTTASQSTANTTGTASLLQPNTFLDLLVDELKYQDPLDPTNTSDFMNQIAELSQVEQLSTVSSSSQLSEAASLVGKSVTGTDDAGNIITGQVTGVTTTSNGPELNVGGSSITLANVQQIGASSTSSSGSTSS